MLRRTMKLSWRCRTEARTAQPQKVAQGPFSSPEPPFVLVTWLAKRRELLVNDILRRVALGTRMHAQGPQGLKLLFGSAE